MKTNQPQSAILNVRLRPALKAEIERLPARDQRTLSNSFSHYRANVRAP
jgi:hypothetical protein